MCGLVVFWQDSGNGRNVTDLLGSMAFAKVAVTQDAFLRFTKLHMTDVECGESLAACYVGAAAPGSKFSV
jgi:hypothetical protein